MDVASLSLEVNLSLQKTDHGTHGLFLRLEITPWVPWFLLWFAGAELILRKSWLALEPPFLVTIFPFDGWPPVAVPFAVEPPFLGKGLTVVGPLD